MAKARPTPFPALYRTRSDDADRLRAELFGVTPFAKVRADASPAALEAAGVACGKGFDRVATRFTDTAGQLGAKLFFWRGY
jgi:hypothetical protein